MLTLLFFRSIRPLVCEDIQADVEDGQLQFFYILAFVLQGDTCTHSVTLLWNFHNIYQCKNLLSHAFFQNTVLFTTFLLFHERSDVKSDHVVNNDFWRCKDERCNF